jgi:hypothetical protein
MATDTSSPAVAELAGSVQRLHADLESIRRELDQALTVWQTALTQEKQNFHAEIQKAESTWQDRAQSWDQQKLAYEKKIEELESFFRTQIAATEQNALRALNELDDAWQRDKLGWGHSASIRIKELEALDKASAAERLKTTQTIQSLEARLVEAQASIKEEERRAAETQLQASTNAWDAEKERYESRLAGLEKALAQAEHQHKDDLQAAIEATKAAWEHDKNTWQQSLWQTLQDLSQREAAWAAERDRYAQTAQRLQQELVSLQNRLSTDEKREDLSTQFVGAYMQALEHEVDFLGNLVTRANDQPNGQPLRRRTDLIAIADTHRAIR